MKSDRPGLRFRTASAPDAEAVAGLHPGSWRRHYRGAYSDAFRDGDVLSDRLHAWFRLIINTPAG